MDELLKGFPVVVELPVVWGEMDARQHVNNAVYFRYFESARTVYFEKLGVWKMIGDTGIGVILASINCRFRIPLTFPDRISVGVRVVNIQEDRFTVEHRIVSHHHQKIAAEGDGLLVAYDYNQLKKTLLPDAFRQRIQELERTSQS
ncbi:MAG: acyl-CoA thioesterase [Blastocatellia bacterium]|nr:acyl-CoA thioesterase [Blastocatellia bacterium]